MATFLARRAAAATTTQPVSDAVPKAVDADARILQAKVAAALGDARHSPDPDADLLALYRQYREARKDMHKVFAGRICSEAEGDLVISRCHAILREIAKMPATTLRGFGAKMDVLRNCECSALEKVCPRSSDEILLQSIAVDSYRLFGSGDALASEEGKIEGGDDATTRSGACGQSPRS